jgi:2-polyprenyl-3-methyl-5-hydroxy-6-metoxy-1,4-benzoquinol methylase
MKLIAKIARKFGYNIVRYKDPNSASKKIAQLHVDQITLPLIKQSEAHKALQGVNRQTNISSFTYFERPQKTTESIDRLESLWWNTHGELIDKVWGFSEKVNFLYRNNYVAQAATFFKHNEKNPKILDLGCGSGWFGRMIVDPELEYHGVDFSSTQIKIANQDKETSPNKNQLHYYCLEDFKEIENLQSFTGVVIHAFLHHLCWEELSDLFDDLKQFLPAGCKFFIVEPVYPDAHQIGIDKNEQSFNLNFVLNYRAKLNQIKLGLIDQNIFDTQTEYNLNKVGAESQNNGFFFSPKEVPFRMTEFKNFLSPYLKIEHTFQCGVLDLETAQLIELINDAAVQQKYADLLFPLANALDRFLLLNQYFEANENNYLFTAFQGVLVKPHLDSRSL